MKRVAGWLAWYVVLWWLWMLLVGEWNHVEWIAATIAALVAASVLELMRWRLRVVARVPFVWVRRAASVPHQIVVDFGIVARALFRPAADGVFRTHRFEPTGDDPADVGARAWVDWVANFSPNAVAVDIDCELELSLVHDLVPNRASERPA